MMDDLIKKISDLKERAQRLEELYKEELESELRPHFLDDKLSLTGLSHYEETSVKDQFLILSLKNYEVGTLFPFRRRAFIYEIGPVREESKRGVIIKTLERRGYTVSINQNYIAPLEHIQDFHRYSGTE